MALTVVVEGEEPIVSRLDRLDHMLMHLEEIKGCNNRRSSLSPTRSSCTSTPSTVTTPRSEGPNSSSLDWSPKSMEKYCRPIDAVLMEIEVKGNLIDRLNQVEDRVLKLCEHQLEEEKKIRGKEEQEEEMKVNKKEHRKSLKQLVKSCVHPRGKSKAKKNLPSSIFN